MSIVFFLLSFSLLFASTIAQPPLIVDRRPLILPLSFSSPRFADASKLELRRHLHGVSPNARMRLYDDLLSNGYYTTRLWIGSPPQEFALIVDTGSTVTYVPCNSCDQCGNHQELAATTLFSSVYGNYNNIDVRIIGIWDLVRLEMETRSNHTIQTCWQ